MEKRFQLLSATNWLQGAVYNLKEDEEVICPVELASGTASERLAHENEALAQWGPDEGAQRFCDNISGEELPAEKVCEARREEIDFMLEWDVWEEVPIAKCWHTTGKAPSRGDGLRLIRATLNRPISGADTWPMLLPIISVTTSLRPCHP